MAKGRLLVIDKGAVNDALQHVVGEVEYMERARAAGTPDAVARAANGNFDAVIADLSDPGICERRAVARLKEVCPDVPVIVASNSGDGDMIGVGAFECLRVPVDPEALRRAVVNAVDKHRLLTENRALSRRLTVVGRDGRRSDASGGSAACGVDAVASTLVGESEAVCQIRRFICEVAPTDMTVLITGESGTGKEVVARAIHAASLRNSKGSLIKINCPAVPEQLLESELFGHEPGAFTGAVDRKPGRLELAVGGTAFLDEIGEIPLSVQAKLLQVLEHKQFIRLGGTDTLGVDVRFVAATNIPLLEQIGAGHFRKDLYFRLNQYVIPIPALRERAEDIPLLVDHFLEKYAPMYGRNGLTVSEKMMGHLIRHGWPGNVRELESVVQCYALTGREESILTALAVHETRQSAAQACTYRQYEKNLIMATLVEAKWNRRRAADALGMSYNTLRRRIAQYGLDGEEPQCTAGTPGGTFSH